VPRKDEQGNVLGWFGVTTDIHEQKQLEERLREQDRRKNEFLATLAHELRNPLAPVRNAVSILRHPGLDAGRLTWCRDVIDRQTEHLARLVDDLLDVSRITQGKITLRLAPTDLAEVVRQAVETSLPLLEARRHELTVSLPAEPVRVSCDLTRLAQVVSNLLNNAAKYTDEGGRVWLAVERDPSPLPLSTGGEGPGVRGSSLAGAEPLTPGPSPLSTGARGEEAVLRVRDNGRGIDPALQPNLFDLFYQVERNLDRSEGGLGIGLALVKSLVERHGGTVTAHSAGRGQGSEFIIRLPCLADPAPGAEVPAPARQEAPAGRGLRVLVVDDNVDTAHSMALLLGMLGHEVLTAHDGRRAVDLALRGRPEVVFLDIGLPSLDGYQACRAIREGGLAGALVVAMTGYGQEEDQRRSREAGFDAHYTKPVKLETIRELLARRAEQAPDG
jgi:signal transduction histidine kinase/ActR/RegA family two-component response regulator